MDEIFDRIKDTAAKARENAERIAKEVAKRTSKAITQTKLSFAVNEAENKIKDVYTEIGKALYTMHLNGENTNDSFAASFEQLDKLNEDLELINAKLAELKNSVKCDECGAYNENDAEYCAKCGSQLNHKEAEAEAEDDIDSAFAEAEDDDEEVIVIDPKKPE